MANGRREDEFILPPVGSVVEFKGCVWDDGWEFDAPLILYSPVERYDHVGSICPESLESIVEDVCIDLCIKGFVKEKFIASDLDEFRWRSWSPKGFSRRRRAVHGTIKVKFTLDGHGERSFEYTSRPKRLEVR